MLVCEDIAVRISAPEDGRRRVTSACRIGRVGHVPEAPRADVIRVESRIAVFRRDRDPWRDDDAELALAGTYCWGPGWMADAGPALSVDAAVPADVPMHAMVAHIAGTAHVGRWWPLATAIHLRDAGARGGAATWCDTVTSGTVRLLGDDADDPVDVRRTLHVSARLREPQLMDGMPLVVLRAETVGADDSVFASSYVVLWQTPTDEDEGNVTGEGSVAVALPIAPPLPDVLRVRLTLGVSTYRYARVGRFLPLAPVGHVADGAHVVTPSAGETYDLDWESNGGPSDADLIQLLNDHNPEWPIQWQPETSPDEDDDEAPVAQEAFVVAYRLESDSHEIVTLDELNGEERANPASLCWADVELERVEYENLDATLPVGVEITHIDMIWDGITPIPGVTAMPGASVTTQDDGEVQVVGPIMRVHLSLPVSERAFRNAISANGVSVLPESRRIRSVHHGRWMNGRYGAALLTERYARCLQAALLLGGGYVGKMGITPKTLASESLAHTFCRREAIDTGVPLVSAP